MNCDMGFVDFDRNLRMWVSDRLISFLGYSKPEHVMFLLGLSKQAYSPSDIVEKLLNFDVHPSVGDFLSSFAQELFTRVRRKEFNCDEYDVGEEGVEPEKSPNVKIADNWTGKGVEVSSSSYGCKRKERMLFHHDHDRDDTERKREKRCKGGNLDALPSESRQNCDVGRLRKTSRQEYLMKREEKKLKDLKTEIDDEEDLFEGVKMNEIEYQRLKHKKNIHEIVNKHSENIDSDHLQRYVIPGSYDVDGSVNQKERFGVALKKYRDEDMNNGYRTNLWEDQQLSKATLKFGSQYKNYGKDDKYPLILDSVAFEEDDMIPESSTYSKSDSLEKERRLLPIFEYKDKLLQAIHEHQVIIIVGETGSGKTTQIPQYLHEAGYTKSKKVVCTQPRRVAAMSVATRVAQEMHVKLGHEVGYSIRFEDCTSEKTVLKYMTDGMLLRTFLVEPDLASCSVVIIDEAHERTVSTDILLALLKDLTHFRPDLKLLISSATLNSKKFSDYFDCAPIFNIPGRRYPVQINHTIEPQPDYQTAAVNTVLRIHETEEPGDILVFLTGQEEIEHVQDMLRDKTKDFGSKIAELIVHPIYANLPTEKQAKIFKPTPKGSRKVVLATNIAETSITIDGIKYVIDPGYCKMNSYSSRTGMEVLQVTSISKASAKQREGRAGRTSPGKCFRLYTAHTYKYELSDETIPEIQRTNLANVVLTLKSLGINDMIKFDFMSPPSSDSLIRALELLYALGALNSCGKLTKLGQKMSELPLDPMLSKMIISSKKFKCSQEIITIAAMLSAANSIFYRPKSKRVLSDGIREGFYEGNVGDQIALLRVYNEWKSCGYYGASWCCENYINYSSMKRVRNVRDQLERLLEMLEIEETSNLNDLEAIKKAITSGFFPHIAILQKDGSYRTVKYRQTVHIHPSSGLMKSIPNPKWVVYHEVFLTSREYMRQVIEIKPEWLLEIAPHYYQLKDVNCS